MFIGVFLFAGIHRDGIIGIEMFHSFGRDDFD
jgi:hypothetical protein